MFRGQETCKILKQIRQNIASETDIPLVVEECHYKGECRGTCPRCEAELEYLERELMKRRSMGKKLVLAGLSAGLSWTPMVAAENIQVSEVSTQQDTTQNDGRTILIKGTVVDSNGESLYGASVMIQGTAKSVETDFDGKYSIYVKSGDVLEISCIGYKTVFKSVDKIKLSTLYGWQLPCCDGFKSVDDLILSSTLNVVMKEEEITGLIVETTIKRASPIDSMFWEYNYDRSSTPSSLISDEEYRCEKGYWRDLNQDIQYHKVYPKVKEIKENVEVKVRFVINADRSLSDFKIAKSDDERFNEAAIETIKRMDGWRCRKVNGKPVETRKTVKIIYWKEELQRLSRQRDEK